MTVTSYAVVTPVRNEAEGLPRLAESLAAQTVQPQRWVIVENGSSDGTPEEAARLAAIHPWIVIASTPGGVGSERALPIVSAFTAGIGELQPPPDVVAKVDADVSVPPSYWQRLLEELDEDRALGVVSGTCFELDGDIWRERHVTGTSVWGAARAYRWTCLAELLPLEVRTAWDWIDVAEANLRGWTTRIVRDAPFYHHRREGERAATSWAQWSAQGRAAHYLGYRPSYLILRAIYQGLHDPAALALISAYGKSALRRSERCAKAGLIAYVREQQRFRNLRSRAEEARGSANP